MRKFLSILLLGLLFSWNAYSAIKEFTLSCKGTFKSTIDNPKFDSIINEETFYEDIILLYNDKEIKITSSIYTSHTLGRASKTSISTGTLESWGNGKILLFTWPEIETSIAKNFKYEGRLSLINSSYVGNQKSEIYSDKYGVSYKDRSFESMCDGTEEILNYIGN